MSKLFNGSNQTISALEIFTERTEYNLDDLLIDFSQKYDNLIFFNLYEFQLYGRVGRLPVPIVLNNRAFGKASLKNVDGGGARGVQLVNFVADAFSDFKQTFIKKEYKRQQLREDDPYLGNVQAHKGYANPDAEYYKHRQSIFNAINQHIQDKNIMIRNFDDFLVNLTNLFMDFASKIPVTRAGFVKSRFCTPLVSGLVVEISDLPYDDDQRKYDVFINSPNFEFYLNNAREHGFYVDAGAPWRMIANLGSPLMQRYMRNYGVKAPTIDDTTNTVLSNYYDLASVDDFQLLIRSIVAMYNSFVGLNPYEVETIICNDGESKTVEIRREEASVDRVAKFYPLSYWLNLYLRLRNIESDKALNEQQLASLYKNLTKMVDNQPLRDILLYLEVAICDLSDESGSYHEYYKNLTDEEKFKTNLAISRGSRVISSY